MRAPVFAGTISPLSMGLVARRTRAARAVAVPAVPPVVPSPEGAATGGVPPDGALAGAGVGGASGAREAVVLTVVKNAHVSKRPKRVRSCGPVTFVVPF